MSHVACSLPSRTTHRSTCPSISNLQNHLGNRFLRFRSIHQRSSRHYAVQVQNFGFLKQLGLKKPGWLPDFGAEKRKDLLTNFFGSVSVNNFDQYLSNDFKYNEEGGGGGYSKSEWRDVMMGSVLPAIPDFKWSAATDGIADKDGYAIVITQLLGITESEEAEVTGHHTGEPLTLPGRDLPPVPPSGRRISLREGKMRVKVEGGKITTISVMPGGGASLLSLYKAAEGGGETGGRAAPGSGKATYDTAARGAPATLKDDVGGQEKQKEDSARI